MANYADRITDARLAQLEHDLAEIYKQASDELQEKSNKYFSKYAARYELEYDAYLAGEYTDAQFKLWWYSQVGRGERWNALKTDMAINMMHANQRAAAMINDSTPGIYALNANFTAYEIEQGTGVAFNLVREQTVRALMNGQNFSEFRTLSVNPQRDYKWNTERIQKAILSGVLQGDGPKELTKRYMDVMESNKTAAVRNARTAYTSAQNGGRQHTFNSAVDLGIDVRKEWVATNDKRTRDSHIQLDGVVVDNDREFPNGCMYPGDPAGAPEEVYNCRCAMVPFLPKYSKKRASANNQGNNTESSYKKWLEAKKAQQTEDDKNDKIYVFTPASDIAEVKTRMSEALGISESFVNLGRMDLGLANEYLDGVETFVNDFPEIKGLYTSFDTKVGGGGRTVVYGVNKISGRGAGTINGETAYQCEFVLAFKSPRDVEELRKSYAYGIATKQHYENACPKATAIHELVHGLDYAIKMRENGYFENGVLRTRIKRSEWYSWTSTASKAIVEDTKMEIWGAVRGREVYDGISYLGSYSLNNNQEMLAEAISYEYINKSKSNKYSATMLEKLKTKVRETFK